MVALWEHYQKRKALIADPEVFADNAFYFEVPHGTYVPRFESSDDLILLDRDQMHLVIGGAHQGRSAITAEYARLIRNATDEIKIANLYLSPADEIFDALLDAVNRGVKLTILTNGREDGFTPEFTNFFCWANRMSYIPFFHGKTFSFWDYWNVKETQPKKTQIYEYHVRDILLHKKVMLVDGHLFVVGSYNLGIKSHLSDYESVMVIDSAEVAAAADKVFQRDLEHSQEVSHDQACEWYFDIGLNYLGQVQKQMHGLL